MTLPKPLPAKASNISLTSLPRRLRRLVLVMEQLRLLQ